MQHSPASIRHTLPFRVLVYFRVYKKNKECITFNKMNEEQETNASASPTRVMRRFVHCVDDGEVRQELAEDSILNFLGRNIKGGNAVTGYMRTQLAGRFRHVGFQEAHKCSAAKETAVKDRFARSFQALRRHIKASKNIPPYMHSRAESDDEVDDVDVESRPNPTMVTPPRSTTVDQSTDLMQYIESVGVLEAIHEQNDGGIYLGESCQVTLTLGYRCTPLLYKSECAVEICLVVYDKFRKRTLPHSTATRTSGMQRHQRSRSPRNTNTDDEGEVPAPRTVRRMLFTSAGCDDPEDSLGISPAAAEGQSPSLPALTPRKRQHKNDSNVKTKRPAGLGGMRF